MPLIESALEDVLPLLDVIKPYSFFGNFSRLKGIARLTTHSLKNNNYFLL